jgi:hypothetical protein
MMRKKNSSFLSVYSLNKYLIIKTYFPELINWWFPAPLTANGLLVSTEVMTEFMTEVMTEFMTEVIVLEVARLGKSSVGWQPQDLSHFQLVSGGRSK